MPSNFAASITVSRSSGDICEISSNRHASVCFRVCVREQTRCVHIESERCFERRLDTPE
jgi:hypothetical protein